MENLAVGGSGDKVILIDFDNEQEPRIENIRQVITYGDIHRKYHPSKDPYCHYEVDWCAKHKQLIFYASINGFDGLSGLVWIHPDHRHWIEESDRINQASLEYLNTPEYSISETREFSILPALEAELQQAFLDGYETEYGTIFCQIEEVTYPDDPGYVDSPHLIWLHHSDYSWGGCGSAEGELTEEEKEMQLYPLLDLAGELSVAALEEALRSHNYCINAKTVLTADCNIHTRTTNFGQTENCWESCSTVLNPYQQEQWESAIAWLNSLRSGITNEADILTAGWIKSYRDRAEKRSQ